MARRPNLIVRTRARPAAPAPAVPRAQGTSAFNFAKRPPMNVPQPPPGLDHGTARFLATGPIDGGAPPTPAPVVQRQAPVPVMQPRTVVAAPRRSPNAKVALSKAVNTGNAFQGAVNRLRIALGTAQAQANAAKSLEARGDTAGAAKARVVSVQQVQLAKQMAVKGIQLKAQFERDKAVANTLTMADDAEQRGNTVYAYQLRRTALAIGQVKAPIQVPISLVQDTTAVREVTNMATRPGYSKVAEVFTVNGLGGSDLKPVDGGFGAILGSIFSDISKQFNGAVKQAETSLKTAACQQASTLAKGAGGAAAGAVAGLGACLGCGRKGAVPVSGLGYGSSRYPATTNKRVVASVGAFPEVKGSPANRLRGSSAPLWQGPGRFNGMDMAGVSDVGDYGAYDDLDNEAGGGENTYRNEGDRSRRAIYNPKIRPRYVAALAGLEAVVFPPLKQSPAWNLSTSRFTRGLGDPGATGSTAAPATPAASATSNIAAGGTSAVVNALIAGQCGKSAPKAPAKPVAKKTSALKTVGVVGGASAVGLAIAKAISIF